MGQIRLSYRLLYYCIQPLNYTTERGKTTDLGYRYMIKLHRWKYTKTPQL